MDCAGIRFGLLHGSIVGKVRIKADQQAGIYFNMFGEYIVFDNKDINPFSAGNDF